MLLTSGQISMGISSIIVFIFSTLLFLSGYILQQRTVRDIQEILTTASQITPTPSQNPTISTIPDTFPWEKAAYVQVLTRYSDICGAGMTFAELARQGSKARRVLVYPRSWEDETKSETKGRDRSLRLLRRVIVRYGISLRGVEMDTKDDRGIRSVFEIGDLDRVVFLRGTGVVYNASALDELFLEDEKRGRYFVGGEGEVIAAMLKPGTDTHQKLQEADLSSLSLEEILRELELQGKYDGHLFSETRALKGILTNDEMVEDRDGLQAAYMQISDPGILGPEYDIPQQVWEQARPDNTKQRKVWEGIYADYRAQRMAVCGLEVEPLPKTVVPEEGIDL